MSVAIGIVVGFIGILIAKSQGIYLQSPVEWINETEQLKRAYAKRHHTRA